MSLLFADGFDIRDTTVKWDAYALYGSLGDGGASFWVTGRYGTGVGLRFHNYASQLQLPNFRKFITPSAQVFMGAAFQINGGQRLMLLYGDFGATLHVELYASGGVLSVYRGDVGGTLLAQSAPAKYIDGQWNYFEMSATVHDTAGRVVVRMNGNPTPIIDFTGDTRNGGTSTNFDMIQIANANNNVMLTIDDLYVCNSAGSRNNDFLGEIRITTCLPSGAGSSTQFTPTGVANNWDNVNDIPASTATYNSSSTVGQRDTYAMSDLPVGVGQIFGMQTVLLTAKSDAGLASLKGALKLGAGVYYDPTISLSSNALEYAAIREVDPSTGNPWLVAGVNSMEFGAEVA